MANSMTKRERAILREIDEAWDCREGADAESVAYAAQRGWVKRVDAPEDADGPWWQWTQAGRAALNVANGDSYPAKADGA